VPDAGHRRTFALVGVRACGSIQASLASRPDHRYAVGRSLHQASEPLPRSAVPFRHSSPGVPESAVIRVHRRLSAAILARHRQLKYLRRRDSRQQSCWIAPRRSPQAFGTSDAPWSPKRTGNRPKLPAQRRDTLPFKLAICRRSWAVTAGKGLPENRGVPGSSPGLAISSR
jgi:hypothetical protein